MTEKTQIEKAAWLAGFKAASETASSFRVRVGHEEVDKSLNTGAQMVASLFERQVRQFEEKQNDNSKGKPC